MWPLAWCHTQLSTFSTSEVLFASNMIFITATIPWKCATSCKYQKPYWITNCSLLSELGFDHCSLFWVPYAQGHHIFNLLLSSLEWKYLSFFLLMCHFQNLCHRTSTFVLVHALCHARVTGVTHCSGVFNNNLTLSLFCVFHNTLMYRMETISIMNKNWVSNYWLPHLSRWSPPGQWCLWWRVYWLSIAFSLCMNDCFIPLSIILSQHLLGDSTCLSLRFI